MGLRLNLCFARKSQSTTAKLSQEGLLEHVPSFLLTDITQYISCTVYLTNFMGHGRFRTGGGADGPDPPSP